MILDFKKFAATAMCSSPIAFLISNVCRNKIRYFGDVLVDTSDRQISGYLKCMIFWKMYEKAEARSIIKYLTDAHDVVELGSSIGVVGCLAGKLKGDRRLLCVEVNQELIPLIERNMELNRVSNYRIRNVAIGSGDESIWFTPGKHSTHGQVGAQVSEDSIKIESMALSALLAQESIGEFVLICDIEGSEIDIILDDSDSLKNCKLIVMETHAVRRKNRTYSPEAIRDLIVNAGFACIEERNVNYVFVRKQ